MVCDETQTKIQPCRVRVYLADRPLSVYHGGKSGQELKQRHCEVMLMGLFLYITQGHLPSVGFVHSGLGPPTSITKLLDVHPKAKVKKAIPQLRLSSHVTLCTHTHTHTFWVCALQYSAHTRVEGT